MQFPIFAFYISFLLLSVFHFITPLNRFHLKLLLFSPYILPPTAAGTGTYTDNDIIGYEEIPSSWVNSNEQYVVLKISGDSMYPEFQDGDHVLVRVQSSVDSGDYGIVLIDGDSAVIKEDYIW